MQLAFGQGGQASGTQDVFQTIANQPFGQFLLAIMALGLVGYSIWLFVRAGIDTSNQGTDASGHPIPAE